MDTALTYITLCYVPPAYFVELTMLVILLLTILKLVPGAGAIGKLYKLPNLISLQLSQGDISFKMLPRGINHIFPVT